MFLNKAKLGMLIPKQVNDRTFHIKDKYTILKHAAKAGVTDNKWRI